MMRHSLPLALLLLTGLATPAVAQEGGLLDINEGLMVWTIIIFLFVLGVLYWKAYPVILGAVEAREARIADLLSAAQRDREEAQTLLEEQRARHEELRTQVQEMLAEGRTAGERVREEIIAEARGEQQAMLERARREIEQETERALAELKGQAVDLAIAAASRLVEKDLDQEGNRRFVHDYLARLEIADGATVARA
ncbi:MAG TPA: F0F1 ATP synthase subunit B [Longimicrobiaceae bacterium]|jgi:F-type H+-transporting ATPase subunit b